MKKSYINATTELSERFIGRIVIDDYKLIEDMVTITVVISVSSVTDAIWMGNVHVWTYHIGMSINSDLVTYLNSKCTGGYTYAMPENQIDFLTGKENELGDSLKGIIAAICRNIKYKLLHEQEINLESYSKEWMFDSSNMDFSCVSHKNDKSKETKNEYCLQFEDNTLFIDVLKDDIIRELGNDFWLSFSRYHISSLENRLCDIILKNIFKDEIVKEHWLNFTVKDNKVDSSIATYNITLEMNNYTSKRIIRIEYHDLHISPRKT